MACAQRKHVPRHWSRRIAELLAKVGRQPYLGHMSEQVATGGRIPEWTMLDRLRKSREDAGLEQSELALRIGLGRATVGNYERGDSPIKRPALLSWALATGVPFEWLETGREAVDSGPDGGLPGSTPTCG